MSTHVVLDRTQDAFVEGLAASGRFASAAQIVHEALPVRHVRETRLSDPREAWTESGDRRSDDAVFGDLDRRDASDAKVAG